MLKASNNNILLMKKVLDHGLEGTRVQTSVAANPVDRTHREVHQQSQGRRIYVHTGIHPAGDSRKD